MSISSSSSMLITLKAGAASTMSYGEISKGSFWNSACSAFFPFLRAGKHPSLLPSIARGGTDDCRIWHDFWWDFFTRFDYPIYLKPPWNWFHVSHRLIFMFCISQPVVIPFLDSIFEQSIPNHIRCLHVLGTATRYDTVFNLGVSEHFFNIVSQMRLIIVSRY